MALPMPNLDDRRFQDLVDDAKRMVQQRCPEWTDHNVSDPGVTLIETFAYMTDQLLYRLNRIPDRLHISFLELIGLRLMPPTPARTDVTFWLSTPALTPMSIAAATRVGTIRTENAESIVFSTEEEIDVPSCVLHAVRTRAAGADAGVDRMTALGVSFPAFAEPPDDGDELLIGLDVAVPRAAVRLDIGAVIEGLGVDPRHVPLVWEAWTGAEWAECEVSTDETGGLNASGAVVLHVPAGHRAGVVDGERAGWLRARVVPGQPGYTASPMISGISVGTVGVTGAAVNAEIVALETIGRAEGVAGQRFELANRPVLAGAGPTVVETSSAQGWQEWRQVDDFAASGPDDRHFVLDAYAGEVHFGPVVRQADGTVARHGAVPEKDATVRVRRYAVGGGAVGNVNAGAIRTLRSSIPFVAAVENRHSAHGGVDGETLDEARTRGPLLLRTRSRAVTAEDYEVLARQAVPEAARVRCVTAGEGDVPAGTVKVLVVPAAATVGGHQIRFADLVPSDELLERLAERLAEVRLIGTTVLVEPPRYRGVTVVARLVARSRVDTDRVREDALAGLLRYLNPLPGGGPGGTGWPFGQAVRSGDVHALLQQVSGVDYVEDVRLFTANPLTGERGVERSRIELEPHSLVFSFDHQVLVQERGL
jgi:predicted phage baseplate assembly protein